MSARSERPVAGVVPMVSRPEGAEQGSQDARVGGSRFEKTVAHAVTREGAGDEEAIGPETAEIRANIEAYFARLETRAAAHFF